MGGGVSLPSSSSHNWDSIAPTQASLAALREIVIALVITCGVLLSSCYRNTQGCSSRATRHQYLRSSHYCSTLSDVSFAKTQLIPVFHYSCGTSFKSLTSSPGAKRGNPIYGHDAHLKASPREQLPHDPDFPWTVKSSSFSSSDFSTNLDVCCDLAARRSESPQVHPLHALRGFPGLG